MNRMWAWIIGLIVIAAIVVGIVVASGNNNNNSSITTTTPTNNSSNQSSNASNNSSASSGAKISIQNMMFTPSQVTIKKGQAITWTNNDNLTHTVTEDNGAGPNSGDVAPGQSYSFTYNQTGSFQYHCSIHPSMRGTIVVQ